MLSEIYCEGPSSGFQAKTSGYLTLESQISSIPELCPAILGASWFSSPNCRALLLWTLMNGLRWLRLGFRTFQQPGQQKGILHLMSELIHYHQRRLPEILLSTQWTVLCCIQGWES